MPTNIQIPDSVRGDIPRELYSRVNQARVDLKGIATQVDELRKDSGPAMAEYVVTGAGSELCTSAIDAEVIANVTLAYRAIEDASMRLGKALQALDGGVSVYDKASTVGAP